jgi:CubicO group peptidase (beta-lactamase class C family)
MSLDWLDSILTLVPGWLKEAHAPGAAIAASETGQPVRCACFGVQDLTSQTLVNPETIFEAASLSKPLFAYGMLMLVAEGKLDLDAPLRQLSSEELIPGEERLAQLTARRILSHSSGLPNWFPEEGPRSLRFTPGERFGYSGEGYFYLQRVVETLTNQPLEEFARQRLFSALDMPRSSYVWQEKWVLEAAQGHDETGKTLPKNKPASGNAGTSLHTTVREYARFVEQMISAAPWREAMLTPQTTIDGSSAWGLGWGLKRIDADWVFWQWGDNRGFKHLAAGSRQQGKALCVLTNGENGYQVWRRVLQMAFDPAGEIFNWLSAL